MMGGRSSNWYASHAALRGHPGGRAGAARLIAKCWRTLLELAQAPVPEGSSEIRVNFYPSLNFLASRRPRLRQACPLLGRGAAKRDPFLAAASSLSVILHLDAPQ